MNGVALRALLLLVALVAGAAAAEAARLGGEQGPLHSPLIWASFIAAVCVSLGSLALALAPQAWLKRLAERAALVRKRFSDTPPWDDRMAGVAMTVIALATYIILVSSLLPLNTNIENDQGAYLLTARQLRESGGIAALPGQLVRGEFSEANRQPLYIGLLSMAPTLEAGKLLSSVIGGLSLLIIASSIARQLNLLAAGMVSVLLATNRAFLHTSALVACEGLLLLFLAVVWLLSRPNALPGGKAQRGVGYWCGLSALMSLAWLTKATALPLFAAWWLWLAMAPARERDGSVISETLTQRLGRRKTILSAALIVWLAVASPLLIRNMRRYGSLFFNVNSHLLFVDAYEPPDKLAEKFTVGQMARRYLATHTPGEMIRREVSGLAWEAFIILRALGSIPLDDSRMLFGLCVLGLASAGMAAREPFSARLTLLWGLLSWLLFAWYVPIAAGERFIVPLIVPLLAHAAGGLLRLLGNWMHDWPQMWRRTFLFSGALLWCGVWLAATWLVWPLGIFL